MWNLISNDLPSINKQARRGLPLFTLISTSKVESSTNSLFSSDSLSSDEIVEEPTLTLESKGFIYSYEETLDFPDYTSQSNKVVTTPGNYFSKGNTSYLYVLQKLETSPTTLGVEEIYSSEIEEVRSTAEYFVYPTKQFNEIVEVYSEGLKFTEPNLSFDILTNTISLLGCSLSCRPRIDDPLSTTQITGVIDAEYTIYNALVFDFSDPSWGNIQSIDFLDWQNKTFFKNFSVSNYGVIYDPINKKALCTWL